MKKKKDFVILAKLKFSKNIDRKKSIFIGYDPEKFWVLINTAKY